MLPDVVTPLTIYARWTHRRPFPPYPMTPSSHNTMTCSSPSPHFFIDHYKIVVDPTTPLAISQHIKICALSPKAYHTPILHPSSPTQCLEAFDQYDPGIAGPVIDIDTKSITSHAILEIRNDSPGSGIPKVFVRIRCIPGITVVLPKSGDLQQDRLDVPSVNFIPLLNPLPGPTAWPALAALQEMRECKKPAFQVNPAYPAAHETEGRTLKR
ncbi:hypothetical protein V8D89_000378 [Ganoderma adspersum]